MVRLFGLVQTFITTLLVHIPVVFGIYLLIEARPHPDTKHFIQSIGIGVIVFGFLFSCYWRFITKLATEGLLILADIADGFF